MLARAGRQAGRSCDEEAGPWRVGCREMRRDHTEGAVQNRRRCLKGKDKKRRGSREPLKALKQGVSD